MGPGPQRPTTQSQVLVVAVAILFAVLLLQRHVLTELLVIAFLVAIPSIILHEVSHGFVANLFGDDTAKRAGRLTLNPLAHVSLFGSLLLPAFLVLAGGIPFGFAKPVPVTVSKLRHPRNESVIVALAGPATNVALVAVAAIGFRLVVPPSVDFLTTAPLATQIFYMLGLVNVALAIFNLIPIPPLDGSAVIERLLPPSWWSGYFRVRQMAAPVLMLALFVLSFHSQAFNTLARWEQGIWNYFLP